MAVFLQNCKTKSLVLQFLPKIFIKFLVFTLKNYIILLIFFIMFISTISDMILNYNYKANIPMIIANTISLILIIRSLYVYGTSTGVDFDRVGFAIIISSAFRSISIFSSFAKNALESIKKERDLLYGVNPFLFGFRDGSFVFQAID